MSLLSMLTYSTDVQIFWILISSNSSCPVRNQVFLLFQPGICKMHISDWNEMSPLSWKYLRFIPKLKFFEQCTIIMLIWSRLIFFSSYLLVEWFNENMAHLLRICGRWSSRMSAIQYHCLWSSFCSFYVR